MDPDNVPLLAGTGTVRRSEIHLVANAPQLAVGAWATTRANTVPRSASRALMVRSTPPSSEEEGSVGDISTGG